MDFFQTRVKIYEFPTVEAFVKEFPLTAQDVILTDHILYDNHLENLKLPCHILYYEDYIDGEPTQDGVNAMFKDLAPVDFNRIIGFGGGSIMDTAKLLSLDNITDIADVYENIVEPVRIRKLVLVPTNCGTGSEGDGISAIYLNKYGCKIGRSNECCVPDQSILIPELLTKLPYHIFMHSTADATIHGIEIYLSPFANTFNNVFCAEAVRLNVRNWKRMLDLGPEERLNHLADFMRAGTYGGIGLSHNPCGFIHACAMYFGGVHHTPHGKTNAIFMGPILNIYAKKAPDGKLAEIAKIIREEMELAPDTDVPGVFKALEDMLNTLLPRERLRDLGMPADSAMKYAQSVFDTQNRLVIQSYLPLTVEELASAFEVLY